MASHPVGGAWTTPVTAFNSDAPPKSHSRRKTDTSDAPHKPRSQLNRRADSMPAILEGLGEVPPVPPRRPSKTTPAAPPTGSQSIAAKILMDAMTDTPFMITADRFQRLCRRPSLNTNALLQELVLIAKASARSPVSKYQVGAVALGKSGAVYLGTNLEFSSRSLTETVHAEQFAIANARGRGETEIVSMALSAPPCGCCRQFLNELGTDVQILTPGSEPQLLSALLPDAFGPKDRGLVGGLLTPRGPVVPYMNSSAVMVQAVEVAQASYAPYTRARSGVGIETHDGRIYTGGYIENAAFNPSLSPFHVALVSLVANGRAYTDIKQVVLVEAGTSLILHASSTRSLLTKIAPEASFHVVDFPSLGADELNSGAKAGS